MTIKELSELVTDFRDERDWKQFHNLKDLSAAIAIEASELQEEFLWKSDEEIRDKLKDNKDGIEDEVADILAYLLSFCDIAKIDPCESLIRKLKKNAVKYPITKSKGSNKKYNQL